MSKKNKIVKIVMMSLFFIFIILFTTIIYTYNYQGKNIEIIKKDEIIKDVGNINICFSMQNDCEETLKVLIDSSQKQTVAIYDLDSEKIINSLNKKENSGVIIDEDNYKNEWVNWQKISTPGLMHNKFFVLETQNQIPIVVTGSTNPTFNDFNKNDNNMLIISSQALANNYLEEFSELKNKKPQTKTKNTKINLSGIFIENYFCPEDNCEEKIVLALNNASSSIYFMTFSFTSDAIGQDIIKHKNLDVKGVFDASQVAANKEYSEFYKMNFSHLDVKIEKSKGKLHHKFFIIDNRTVITGSFNPTSSGNTKNEENIVIIHDEKIAQEYVKEFERIWNIN